MLLDRLLIKLAYHDAVLVVLLVQVDDRGQGRRVHIEVGENLTLDRTNYKEWCIRGQ